MPQAARRTQMLQSPTQMRRCQVRLRPLHRSIHGSRMPCCCQTGMGSMAQLHQQLPAASQVLSNPLTQHVLVAATQLLACQRPLPRDRSVPQRRGLR